MADWNGFKKNGTTYIPNDATARAGVIANTKLIKDTVGWSGKNKLPNHAVSTGNFTVNANKTVTVNGTFSAQAVLPIIDVTDDFSSKLPSGDYILVSGITNENVYMSIEGYNNNSWVKSIAKTISGDRKPFTIDYNGYNKLYITLKVKTGTYSNVLVGPMIVDPNCLDFIYEPYRNTTAFPRDEQAVLGASWNELDVTASGKTENGVTFTINADRSVTFVTDAGGATADTSITFNSNYQITDANTHYYSGVSNGAADKYYLECYYRDNSNTYKGNTRVYDGVIPIKVSDYSGATKINTFILMVKSGFISTTPITVYPMVAPIEDAYYAPPAKTNKELTELVFIKRELTSADDLNNIKDTGIYSISSSPTNAPESVSYCTLIVNKRTANNITQMIIAGEGKLYTRAGGGTWQSWYKYSSSVVS